MSRINTILLCTILIIFSGVEEILLAQCSNKPDLNLISNGDFEKPISVADAPNYSGYIQVTTCDQMNKSLWTLTKGPCSNIYYIPATNNGVPGDHTTGNGTYMLIDSDNQINLDAWKSTVSVTPNTTYYFSAWIANVAVRNRNPSRLRFYVNGEQIGDTIISAPEDQTAPTENSVNHNWTQFFTSWNSGNFSGIIDIKMQNVNGNGSGNDLGLDDIYFSSSCKNVEYPEKSNLPDTLNICEGNSVLLDSKLTADAKSSFIWTLDGTTIGGNTPSINATKAGKYFLCYDLRGRGCPKKDSTIVISNSFSITTSHINPDSCGSSNGSITVGGLTAGKVYNLNYTFEGTRDSILSQTANPEGKVLIPKLKQGNYTAVYASLEGCKSLPKEETLTGLNAPLISSIFKNPSTCLGKDGQITISGLKEGVAYDISYRFNGLTPTTVSNVSAIPPGQVNLTNLSSGSFANIFLTINGTNCTTNELSAVLKDPSTPVIKIVSTNPTTCNGTDGSFTISGLEPSKIYDVNYKDAGIITALNNFSSTTQGTIVITGLNSGSYLDIYLKDVQTFCATNTVATLLKDPGAPTITATAVDPSECEQKGTININGLDPATQYNVFYNNPTLNGPLELTSNSSGTIVLAVEADTFSNIKVLKNNCPSNEEKLILHSPKKNPAVQITPANSQICKGTPITFLAKSSYGGINPGYKWMVNGQIVAGTDSTFTSGALNDKDSITVLLTSSSSCAEPPTALSNKAKVTVNDIPSPVIEGDTLFCKGKYTILKAIGGKPNSTIKWYSDLKLISGETKDSLKITTQASYSVAVKQDNCESRSKPLLVKPIEVLVNAGPDKVIFLDDPSNPIIAVPLVGQSNGSSHVWHSSDNNITINNPDTLTTTVNLKPGNYSFSLSDNIRSCHAIDNLSIVVKIRIWIPDAISPNNDGDNDRWIIKGLEYQSEYTVSVYNRYGSIVHEQKNSYEPWNGYRNGEAIPVGTYYYVVDVKGLDVYTGDLTIMR